MQELEELIERKTWKVIKKSSLPLDASILNESFVLSTESKDSENEIKKDRFGDQTHRDKEK